MYQSNITDFMATKKVGVILKVTYVANYFTKFTRKHTATLNFKSVHY